MLTKYYLAAAAMCSALWVPGARRCAAEHDPKSETPPRPERSRHGPFGRLQA